MATLTRSRRVSTSLRPTLPIKRVTVIIYRNGILTRVVHYDERLDLAEIFCEHFNRLNRWTDLVATYVPLATAGKDGGR